MDRMLPDGRRLGAHLPLGSGMVRAVERAHEIGADTIQIFTDNPAAWHRRTGPPREIDAFRERLDALGIGPVAIHAPYLVNLAGPDEEIFEKSIDLLAGELAGASTFRGRYVNVHIGSHRGTGVEVGISRLADGVARTLATADSRRASIDAEVTTEAATDDLSTTDDPSTTDVTAATDDPSTTDATAATDDRPILVLENSAGSGYGLGVDVQELGAIADAIRAQGVPDERIGFCLDTAHAWAAGIDLSAPGGVDSFLEAFDRRIALERLVMVHLNDSRVELGARHDRHEHIGAGRIGPVGLGHLLRHPRLAHVTFYLETPGMDVGYDAVNVARARAIAAGQPLDVLPPEAFDLTSDPGSRNGPA